MKSLYLLFFCSFIWLSVPTFAAVPSTNSIEKIELAAPILPVEKKATKAKIKWLKHFFSPPKTAKKHRKQYGGENNIGLWFFPITMSGAGALGYLFVELLTIGVGVLMPLAVILGMMICTWMSYILLRRSKSFKKGNEMIMFWLFLFVGIWGAALALGGAAAGLLWLEITGYILLSIFLIVLRVL